jgi:adenylate kinase family enzyme
VDRVVVVGACGSGKTTVARSLATKLGAPFVELDALHHGPAWSVRPTFTHDVDLATQGPRWVVDGNYSAVRDLLWSRADAIVWLDLPLWLVEYRVIRRSLFRWMVRSELWNGNRELGPLDWLDPEHPIRWAWKRHPEYRVEYAALFGDPALHSVARVRLRTRAEVRRFLRAAASTTLRNVGSR